MTEHPAENDARARTVAAAVNLTEAWVEFWAALKALGEATREPHHPARDKRDGEQAMTEQAAAFTRYIAGEAS